MRSFLVGLFTNRFGIVLATLNVCYFVSRKFVHFTFSHGGGDDCLIFNHHIMSWIRMQCATTLLSINSPAIIASAFPGKVMQVVFPDFCTYTQAQFQIAFLLFFITLQWLFIGWAAKTIAQKLQSN